MLNTHRFLLVVGVLSCAAPAFAEADGIVEIDAFQPRRIKVRISEPDPEMNRRVAQRVCVNHFFGDNASATAVASPGIFVGGVFFVGSEPGVNYSARGVIGPSVTFQGGGRFRLTEPTCDDAQGGRAEIPQIRPMTVKFEGNGHWVGEIYLGASAVSFADFRGLAPVAISGGASLFLGVSRNWVWWSDPTNFASRKETALQLGILAAAGVASLRQVLFNTDGTTREATVAAGAIGLGGTISFTMKL
jgi:hypothetical protein